MVRFTASIVCVLVGLTSLGCSDSSRSKAAASLPAGLQITTASLPDGSVGSSYNQTLAKANGKSPFTWIVVSGDLPDGLDLGQTNGRIEGTPTAPEASTFRVRVTDSDGAQSERELVILVAGEPVAWKSGTFLNPGTVGQQYAANLNQNVEGGTQPISFTVSQGSLPPGLTLTQAGVLSGTPTQAGTFQIVLRATSAPDSVTGVSSVADLGTSFVIN
jgi:large repetitive protein